MSKLSSAFAKGRRNTAGFKRLAVFFLICPFVFFACSTSSPTKALLMPFARDGKIYSFTAGAALPLDIKAYELPAASDGYIQKAVSNSKKEGFILAWSQKSQFLYHIDSAGLAASKVKISGSIAYVDKNYVLVQTNAFDQNKGFAFTLYSIKYSRNKVKISAKKIWNGNIDCFVSDSFFTSDGVCIGGGTQDDTKHNVYYITSRGIHKCFTTSKNSDFLRLLNTDSKVYAFLSGRDKSSARPVFYGFTLDNYIEGNQTEIVLNLAEGTEASGAFECFFGYGFVTTKPSPLLVIPASFDGDISFICYDYKTKVLQSLIPDAVGCMTPLGDSEEGFYYIGCDPLNPDSYYGICLFDGNSCKKIQKIY